MLKFEGANGQDYLPKDMQAMKDLESFSFGLPFGTSAWLGYSIPKARIALCIWM